MHKDTVEGTAKDAAGEIKKKTGQLTDNERMEAARESWWHVACSAIPRRQEPLDS